MVAEVKKQKKLLDWTGITKASFDHTAARQVKIYGCPHTCLLFDLIYFPFLLFLVKTRGDPFVGGEELLDDGDAEVSIEFLDWVVEDLLGGVCWKVDGGRPLCHAGHSGVWARFWIFHATPHAARAVLISYPEGLAAGTIKL